MTGNLDLFLYNGEERNKDEDCYDLLNLNEFDLEDWTFKKADTKEFTHLIFNDYPARMIPQIARKLINLYYPKYKDLKDKKPILDPFGGSGTTCVEAMLKNIDSIAFDLNPLAGVITNVRTSLIPRNKLKYYYEKLKKEINENKNQTFEQYFPNEPNLEYWFSKTVLQDLSIIKYSIEISFSEKKNAQNEIFDRLKNFFLICYAKTARDCSYQRSGEHKSYRIKKNKIPEFDKRVNTIQYFDDLVVKYSNSLDEFFRFFSKNKNKSSCQTFLSNSMELDGIKNNSIDLIVTSPPYGDSHTTVAYGQFSRFPLEWLQYEREDVRIIDNSLLGGIKNDKILKNTLILFETSKRILFEEVKQQNEFIKEFCNYYENLDIISEYEILDQLKDKLKTSLNFEIRVNQSNTLSELIDLKQNFFKYMKDIRSSSNILKKIIREKTGSFKIKDFRIYDERLPYVLSFFSDLLKVLNRLFDVLDYDRKCCIVIGNRTVKRVKIPTDEIIIELGKNIGFEHLKTFYREIPNKRMPRKNSPTNIPGELLSTMNHETIIILNKPKKK